MELLRSRTGSADPDKLLFKGVQGSLRRLRPFRSTYTDRIHVPCDAENRIRLYQGHPQKDAPTAALTASRTSSQIIIELTEFRQQGSDTAFRLLTPSFPPRHRPLPDIEEYDGFRVTISRFVAPMLQGIVGTDLVPLPGADPGHHEQFASSVEFGLSIHADQYGWSFFDNV